MLESKEMNVWKIISVSSLNTIFGKNCVTIEKYFVKSYGSSLTDLAFYNNCTIFTIVRPLVLHHLLLFCNHHDMLLFAAVCLSFLCSSSFLP